MLSRDRGGQERRLSALLFESTGAWQELHPKPSFTMNNNILNNILNNKLSNGEGGRIGSSGTVPE